jgi:hypothetical protein
MKPFLRALLLLAIAARGSAGEFYVSPRGDDRNPGSRELPFRTLERARDLVRSSRARTGDSEVWKVWLLGGTFQISSPFELTEMDGGTSSSPVLYSALPGEQVRISGGREIPREAFRPSAGSPASGRVNPAAQAHLVQVDLRTLGVSDYGTHRQYGHGLPVVPAPMDLFWNDTLMQLARYPNQGGIMIGRVTDPGSVPRIGDYSNRPGRFLYTDPRHARWVGLKDVWFQGFFNHGFADDKILVASIDTAAAEVRLAAPHLYGLGSGENFNQYVALNILEELDEPGEWYVDRATGILYFWPPSPVQTGRATVSMLESPLIVLENASHTTIRGITIECGRSMGVAMEGGEGNLIEDCLIRNLGTVGILTGQGARQLLPGTRTDDFQGEPVSRAVGSFNSYFYTNTTWDRRAGARHTIRGCEIHATGSGGIILGGGSKKTLQPGGSEVSDCRIHDFNRRNKAGAAGVMVDGCGNRVRHNEIYDGELQAIIVRGNDHLFEYNLIHHVATNSNDASAWYLGRDPSDQGNVVRYNFFHHVGRPDRKWTMGVYCDDATCNVLVEGNVFYRVASYGTVYSNGGHDIVVRNNIFIEGYGPAVQVKSMWYDFGLHEIPYYFGEKGIYTKRLTRAVSIRRPPYSEKYPALADWLDLLPDSATYVGMRPRRNLVDCNVLVGQEETFRLVGKYAQCDIGTYLHVRKDPGFVNAAAMDFRLRPDAEVYRALPDFRPIPFERIGPRTREQGEKDHPVIR